MAKLLERLKAEDAACAGIDTAHLWPGAMKEMVEVLDVLIGDLDHLRDDSNGPAANPYRSPLPSEGRAVRLHHDRARAVLAKLGKV